MNRELEAFSFSVAHDLRAPLRAIDGLTFLVLDDHGDELSAEARSHLGRVRGSVAQMTKLIDDLLHLARVGQQDLRVEEVDLAAMAREAVAQLRRAQPQRQVELIAPARLVCRGDARLLDVVVANLIGNAWKYTSKKEHATIEIGSEAESTYFVRDDGAGFDAANAKKLFSAFQRFHSPDQFEGTGIGLATVQRVVARHGGRIWAESTVGRGATFCFTLPGWPTDSGHQPAG
jgi:light-regulated signal transduction histidine kinase (bacteriophytochrome)